MGYGKRAIKLLRDYYEGQFTNINEDMDLNDDNGKFLKCFCVYLKTCTFNIRDWKDRNGSTLRKTFCCCFLEPRKVLGFTFVTQLDKC